NALAEFLTVAAKLIWIKSRALLPKPPAPEVDGGEDAGEALVRQLQEYRRFKAVAQQLRQRAENRLRAYVRVAPPPRVEPNLDLGGITLDDLLRTVEATLFAPEADMPVDSIVSPYSVTVEEKIEAIKMLSRDGAPFSFRRLIEQAGSRLEVIVTLLAVLELSRQRRIRFAQNSLFGEIIIVPLPEGCGS
ncbi:MAG TPA: hypothetical protein EYH31_01780, partial [Anaerolineae bacterium]|nr:hypothetical protein [Anaerolineae bacterium]